jgi:hypothetical protein
MKNCPSCQQVFQDDALEYCTYDGTPLVRTTTAYGGGPAAGSQWQSPPPGYGYMPGGNYQPTPGGAYPPPYGYASAPAGGEGIAKASMILGICSASMVVVIFILAATMGHSYDAGVFAGILFILALLAGLTAIILGIVALSMAGRNPRVSKAQGIVGLCLGAIPILLLFIGILGLGRFR